VQIFKRLGPAEEESPEEFGSRDVEIPPIIHRKRPSTGISTSSHDRSEEVNDRNRTLPICMDLNQRLTARSGRKPRLSSGIGNR
jgi:hypothetical protein